VDDYRKGLELARSGAVSFARLPSVTVPLRDVPKVLLDPAPDPGVLKVVAAV